jgi:hypothetical protein
LVRIMNFIILFLVHNTIRYDRCILHCWTAPPVSWADPWLHPTFQLKVDHDLSFSCSPWNDHILR